MTARTRARVVTFGEVDLDAVDPPTQGSTWGFDDVRLDDLGRPSAVFAWQDGARRVTSGGRSQLREPGRHQVDNAAAAGAMAMAAGLDFVSVVRALEQARSLSRWRMELTEVPGGPVVVNDAYNANPASMRAALDALAGIGAHRSGRTVAVLGEMKELGESAAAEHRGVGGYAAAAGVDVLLVVGEAAAGMVDGAATVGGWPGQALFMEGRDEALAWLRENVAADDVVLVKASRGAALETVAQGLAEGTTDA
jgi:UDP-N-acetylmuramoyl-tripeptide--D-alanyl-D-alanine ligase